MLYLEQRVLGFMIDHNLVSRGDRIVVAVSGGADSVSLLHILHNVSGELGIGLYVAHLDHGLRDEATGDAEYVHSLAEKLGLPSTIEKRDVRGYRLEHRLSLEEAAREVRYQFLEEVTKRTGAASVAVAHTRNDHIETVLLHLLRGSGLTGLVGLNEATSLCYKRIGPLKVIRPLLGVAREEVEAYCVGQRLDYRTDATNKSLTPTRNRIRLDLLPKIQRDFNPCIDEALERLSHLASKDVDFIESEARQAAVEIVRAEGDLICINREALLRLHPALQSAILRQALAKMLGSPKDIESVHIGKMLELAVGDAGRSVNLSDGVIFASSYDDLMLGRDLSSAIPLPVLEGQYQLNIPGVTEFPGWQATATIDEMSGEPITGESKNPMVGLFDLDAIGTKLDVRPRRVGDRFQPLGMSVEKSVKDFFIDAKVPRTWRPRVPIVVNPGQVVWVAGYRLDDRVKVTPSTRRVLRLEFTQTKTN
jgi:tRNA(Ile)-lysidine synthase